MVEKNELTQWNTVAESNSTRVQSAIDYYRRAIVFSSAGGYVISFMIIVLGVITPILVTLSLKKDLDPGLIFNLQIASIFTSGAIALFEGMKKLFPFERRWATCYMTMLSLRRARADYKLNRIGLVVGSPEWKSIFVAYQNFFQQTIAQETSGFFNDLKLSVIGMKAIPA